MGWGQFGQAIGSLLTKNNVTFSSVDIGLPLTHKVDVLFQMVPTQFIREAFRTNSQFIVTDTIVINGAKGIEKHTHMLPYQIIQEIGPYPNYLNLIGPSFAGGIMANDPTLVSLGYSLSRHVDDVKNLLQTPNFQIQPTVNYMILELAGAMKNVYAILAGYAEGMGFGANTRAKFITLALQEVVKLGQAMGMTDIDVLAPGIVGDMILTCSSPESRNYQFGVHLSVMSQANALKQAKSTVEGFSTSHSVQAIAHKHKVDLPVASLTQQLIEEGVNGRHYLYEFVESLNFILTKRQSRF